MSSAEPPVVWQVHVERTSDPAELRWVGRHPTLAATPPGPRVPSADSCLGELVAEGTVTGVRLGGGEVVVRLADPSTPRRTVERVHNAVVADVTRGAPWLTTHGETADERPTSEQLQAVVDAAAASLLSAHGGRLEVVGLTGPTLVLRAHDACHGCRGASSTITQLVAPVVRRAHPGIVEVVLER